MGKMSFTAQVGNAQAPTMGAAPTEVMQPSAQVPAAAKQVEPEFSSPVGKVVKATDANGTFWEGAIVAVNGDEVLLDIGGKAYPFPIGNVAMPRPLVVEKPAVPAVAAPAAPTLVPVVPAAPVVPAPSPTAALALPLPAPEPMNTLPAPVPASEVPATVAPQTALGGISGEVVDTDYNWPRLNLVQAVGPLSEDWAPGTFLLEKTYPLSQAVMGDNNQPDHSKATEPVIPITVINCRKEFRENTEYGSDEMPETVDTLAEVKAREGTIQWVDDEPPSWVPVVHILLLIEATTQTAVENFPFEFGGKKYALALYTVQKTSYPVFKTLLSATRGRLSGGLHLGGWALYAKREKAGKNMVWKPKLNPAGQHSAEFVNWVAGLQS